MNDRKDNSPTSGPLPIVTTPLDPEEAPSDHSLEGFLRVREYYLNILQDLDLDLGVDYFPAASEIRNRIGQALDWRELQAAAELLRKKLNSFIHLSTNERKESLKFIIEVMKRLNQVEGHLKESARGAAAIYKESEGLTSSMIGDIGELRHETESNVNIHEVKSLVLASLDKFQKVLENSRDSQRRHLKTVSRELDHMQNRFRKVQDRLSEMENENKDLSSRLREDPLTGVHNRIALEERIHQELGLFNRGKHIFSLMMLDLDNFKLINDSYGHAVGDKCLKEVATALQKGIRISDMLARYGGDEFVVVLPGNNKREGLATAEKLRRLVAGTNFSVRGHKIPVTLSVGVTEVQSGEAAPKDLFTRADQALYQAKGAGRNKVRVS